MWRMLAVVSTLAASACAEPHPDRDCGACTTLFASVGVEVVQADGTPALGLDAKTVHVGSGTIVHALNDNASAFYTIADDNTQFIAPDGDVFTFTVLDDSVELTIREVRLGSDACDCHIEGFDVPMRIVLP